MTVVRSASTAVILTAVAAFAHAQGSRPAATLSIDSDAAMVTIAVRSEHTPAFDAILDKLKSALIRSKNPQRAPAACVQDLTNVWREQGQAVSRLTNRIEMAK